MCLDIIILGINLAKTADPMNYDPSGMITFATETTGATNTTRFKTVGFTVIRYGRCTEVVNIFCKC